MLSISKKNITLLLSLFLITLLPPFLKQLTYGSSYAVGTVLAGFAILSIIFIQERRILLVRSDFVLFSIVILFILAHFLLSWCQSLLVDLEFEYQLYRWAGSVIALCSMLLSAQLLSNYVSKNITEEQFSKIINFFASIVLLFAFLAIIGFNPIFVSTETRSFDKPMFVYGEPSHFFLTFGSFILYFLINSKFKNIFMICLLFILAKIKSTVFAVQLLIYSYLSYKKFFIILLVLLSIPIYLNFDYYFSRVDFFSDNRSLSVNAFISGVMRGYVSLFETNFIGFGLNQFGLSNLDTITSHYVYGLDVNSETVANKFDGTILSAKLIGEFGIFGIFFIILYLLFFFKYMIFILKSKKDFISSHAILFFMISIYMSFFIDLFVRSPGYFTSHFYLFLLACSYIQKNSKKIK